MLVQAEADPDFAAHLATIDQQRWKGAKDLRTLREFAVHLPQLPDVEIGQFYERIVEAEASVVGATLLKSDYDNGTASFADELLVIGDGSVLMDAQHGTNPVRTASGKREAADHGTAGLGIVLAKEVGGRIVIPRGRQTGNANVDQQHPVKLRLLKEAAAQPYDAFFSVHGMRPGKVSDLTDTSEIHAVIGLGRDPTSTEYEAAERLVARAKDDYGLRLVVGNRLPHLNFQKDPQWDGTAFRDASGELARTEEGDIGTERVAALMPTSTVSVMRREAGLRSSQLEISRSLRLTPKDMYVGRDPKAVQVGVYLGFQICRLALETR